MNQAQNIKTITRAAIAMAISAAVSFGADPVRAQLTPAGLRSAAPVLRLPDASGRAVSLPDYHGKVVLLDFWATWCGGCKEELPWFADFEKSYKSKGFSVIAVSLDEGGWPVVKPFISANQIPLRVLLDDSRSATQFAIESMPVALLIDRQGRAAAKYVGLVDRANMEANIRTLLDERPDRRK